MTLAPSTDKIGVVDVERIAGTLRSERLARSWSLSDAARELGAVAARQGRVAGSPASLRTQLSRWENGRVAPDASSLALLAELFERPDLAATQAGHEEEGSGAARLRSAVARAAAVDDDAVEALRAQLVAHTGLDGTLGAAGAGAVVAAQLEHLADTVAHTCDPARRRVVTGLLCEVALLGGWQAFDQDALDVAHRRHRTAHDAARLAGDDVSAGQALAGQSAALLAAGLPQEAEAVLRDGPAGGPGAAWVRIARAQLRAATGDAAGAATLFDAAADAAGAHRRAVTDVIWPPVARIRDATLAAHDDRALDGLRETVEDPDLPARDRARLRAQLALALLARGAREEAAEQARRARALADGIGSHRVGRLLTQDTR